MLYRGWGVSRLQGSMDTQVDMARQECRDRWVVYGLARRVARVYRLGQSLERYDMNVMVGMTQLSYDMPVRGLWHSCQGTQPLHMTRLS